MSSMIRSMQKRLMAKSGINPVPVYRVDAKGVPHLVGSRFPLAPTHAAYEADGNVFETRTSADPIAVRQKKREGAPRGRRRGIHKPGFSVRRKSS
jgi:hypothetical protein